MTARHSRTAGTDPGPVYPRAGGRLAGNRAGELARRHRRRRCPRTPAACHRGTRRDQRLPGRPRSLGSVRRPAPQRPGGSPPGRRPAGRGRRAQRAGCTAALKVRLTGCCRRAGAGSWSAAGVSGRCARMSAGAPARAAPPSCHGASRQRPAARCARRLVLRSRRISPGLGRAHGGRAGAGCYPASRA